MSKSGASGTKGEKAGQIVEGESEPRFEEALEKLEQVIANLEEGKINLDDAVQQYQQGVKYLKLCYDLLEKAERRIELLTGLDANGQPIKVDFGEAADADLTTKGAARSQRRSKRTDAPSIEGVTGGETNDMDSGGRLF